MAPQNTWNTVIYQVVAFESLLMNRQKNWPSHPQKLLVTCAKTKQAEHPKFTVFARYILQKLICVYVILVCIQFVSQSLGSYSCTTTQEITFYLSQSVCMWKIKMWKSQIWELLPDVVEGFAREPGSFVVGMWGFDRVPKQRHLCKVSVPTSEGISYAPCRRLVTWSPWDHV